MNTSAAELLFEARGVALGYRAKTVLADVDLRVGAGEAWFLLGTNGSGKTTLLRAILGLLPPRRGVLRRHPQLATAARLGFVPQVTAINPSLHTTVEEFVSLGLAGLALPRPARDANLGFALARVGLTELARNDYWSLSGGQQRRALVARALVRRPGWLVLDEPTEGLDVGTEESLLATLERLNREDGATLLFVTHKLAIAARYASHVALFHAGSVRTGAREEVLGSEAARQSFGVELEALL